MWRVWCFKRGARNFFTFTSSCSAPTRRHAINSTSITLSNEFPRKKKLIISRSDQNVLIRKLFNERRRATKRRQWQSAILLLWGQLRISRTDNNKFSEPNEKKKASNFTKALRDIFRIYSNCWYCEEKFCGNYFPSDNQWKSKGMVEGAAYWGWRKKFSDFLVWRLLLRRTTGKINLCLVEFNLSCMDRLAPKTVYRIIDTCPHALTAVVRVKFMQT